MSGKPCKTCSMACRDTVDKMAIEGHSYHSIAKWLEDTQGIKISHTAIKNHCENHIEGFKPRSKMTHKMVTVEDYGIEQQALAATEPIDPRYIDPIALRRELGCPENITSANDLSHVVKRFMGEILANQLAIVLVKQRAFMQAKCGYPNNEVRGLNNIISTIGDITSRNSGDKNHFDLDKALDFTSDADKFRNELLDILDNHFKTN